MSLKLRFFSRNPGILPVEEGRYPIGGKEIRYVIQRKPRRRRLLLYVDPPGKLRLVGPTNIRTSVIEQFLGQRAEWISAKLAYFRKHPAPIWPEEIKDGITFYHLGAPYSLAIVNEKSRAQGCCLSGGRLEINLPDYAEDVREEARLELILWCKKQAKAILKERTEYWSEKMGLRYRSIAVGSPRRQWGSCSGKNDIRYNWRVIAASMDVINYLVVHELAHIAHKNHSARFWNCVSRFIPDCKTQRRILHCMDPGFSA